MKDFFKIFLILCAIVTAFIFGRNYGEENFRHSDEYRGFIKAKDDQSFTKNDLENAKTKFQNIIDHAATKKSEEVLAQVLQVFLGDLGLKIQDQNSFIKVKQVANKEHIAKKDKVFNFKRIKSYEWILKNSRDSNELKANLKNVEIKDIDSFLNAATETETEQRESLLGSYRGRIMDVTQNEYATLSFDINPIKGSIKIFRNEKEASVKTFEMNSLKLQQVEGSSSVIIDNGTTYYQLYKIPDSQQIVGYYYERLVNGTTKTIGSFVLNRVDQF